MIAKENSHPPREKNVAAPTAAERAGESVKAAAAGAGVGQDDQASSANGAKPVYVPTRRRSRRNLLL